MKSLQTEIAICVSSQHTVTTNAQFNLQITLAKYILGASKQRELNVLLYFKQPQTKKKIKCPASMLQSKILPLCGEAVVSLQRSDRPPSESKTEFSE